MGSALRPEPLQTARTPEGDTTPRLVAIPRRGHPHLLDVGWDLQFGLVVVGRPRGWPPAFGPWMTILE